MGRFLSSVQVRGADIEKMRDRITAPAAWVQAGGWLGIYAEDAQQDLARLEAIAASASEVSERAVAVLVHDSDFVCMSLAVGGRIVDRFSDAPESEGQQPGNAAVWGVPGLRDVWREDLAFAEDKLARAAAMLGIPEALALGNCDALPAGAEWIRTAAAAPVSGVRLEAAGAPPGPDSVPSTGEVFPVSWLFRNAGEAFTGLEAEVSGEGLGLVSLQQGHAYVASDRVAVVRAHPSVAARPEGNIFRFPLWKAPAGERCGFTLLCHAEREGSGELTVRVTPAGRTDAVFAESRSVAITAGPRRPLRFDANTPNAFLYLREMSRRRWLSLTVILRSGPAGELLPVIREWIGGTEAGTARTIKRCPALSLRMPRPKQHRFAGADGWEKLSKDAEAAQSVIIKTAHGGALLQYPLSDSEGRCPHVAFWSEDAADRERLRGLAGRLMDRGGLQAFLVHWDWTPEFDTIDGYANTPYEMSCGARNGNDHMMAAWCSRYLRAVGEETWLGPELREASGMDAPYFVAEDDAALTALEERLAAVLAGPREYEAAQRSL